MMNVVALGLVLSSLVTAGVWSPSQINHHQKGGGKDVIVKEGHRVVVVEYDPEIDGNTKVLISPHDTHVSHQAKEKLSSVADEAKGTKEGVEDAKGKVKEKIDYTKEKAEADVGGTHELICDAFGKCKQKIASTMGIAKDKGSDAAPDITEKADKIEDQAKDKVAKTIGKTKDTLFNKRDEVSSRAHDVKETMYDKVQHVGRGMKEAMDTSKIIGKDVAKNVTSKLDKAREKAERVKEEGERELGEIFGRGRELVKDMWSYIVSPRLVGSAMGIVHFLGFAMAYGMCVWVTFVSSYVLAGALSIQQFGMVQSKVYPVYFRILAYTVMVTLIGHLYGQRNRLFSNTVGMAQAYGLLGSFAMVLFNLLYLEPRATKVMFKRMKMEKEEGRGLSAFGRESFVSEGTTELADHHLSSTQTPPTSAARIRQLPPRTQEKPNAIDNATMSQINKLSERLRKLNSYSSILNILTLVALTSHLAYLGQWLHVTC